MGLRRIQLDDQPTRAWGLCQRWIYIVGEAAAPVSTVLREEAGKVGGPCGGSAGGGSSCETSVFEIGTVELDGIKKGK